MKKQFGLGVLAGIAGTIATAAAAGFTYHKVAIEPIEEEEAKFEETQTLGARKAAQSRM